MEKKEATKPDRGFAVSLIVLTVFFVGGFAFLGGIRFNASRSSSKAFSVTTTKGGKKTKIGEFVEKYNKSDEKVQELIRSDYHAGVIEGVGAYFIVSVKIEHDGAERIERHTFICPETKVNKKIVFGFFATKEASAVEVFNSEEDDDTCDNYASMILNDKNIFPNPVSL